MTIYLNENLKSCLWILSNNNFFPASLILVFDMRGMPIRPPMMPPRGPPPPPR